MFRSLLGFNYRIWFVGSFLTNIGGWMQRTAQDWIVIAHLDPGDVTSVGIVIGLQFAPALLLMPLTGFAADRIDRRRLILATQVSLAAVGAGLGLLTVTGVVALWHVYLFALLLGIVSAFDIPARHAFVSDLVGNEAIPNAIALNSVSFNAGRLIGPAIAGLLTAAWGTGPVFLISAGSFTAAVAALLLMRRDELFRIAGRSRGPGQIRQGFQYIRRRSDIVVLLVMVFLLGMFGLNFSVFITGMTRVEFHRGAAEFGLLSSMLAVGSFAGALLMARWGRPGLRLVSLAAAGFGVACLVAAGMPGYWTFAASLVGIGFTAQTLMTAASSTVQLTTRPAMRGRVVAVYMAVFAGGAPLGAPLVGWIGDELGPRWTLVAGGSAGLLACAVAVGWTFGTGRVGLRYDPGARWRVTLTRAPVRAGDGTGACRP